MGDQHRQRGLGERAMPIALPSGAGPLGGKSSPCVTPTCPLPPALVILGWPGSEALWAQARK